MGIGSGVWPLGLTHYGLKPFPYSLHDSPYIYPATGIPIIKEIKGEIKEIKSDYPIHMIKDFKSDLPLHTMKEYKTEYPIHMMKELKVELPIVMEKSYELPKPVEETIEVKYCDWQLLAAISISILPHYHLNIDDSVQI